MSQYDAHQSLEDIDRYGDSTRDAYVRHSYSTPSIVSSAVALLLVYSALDLPSPWKMILTIAGLAVCVGSVATLCLRAPVRRRPSAAEMGLYLGAGIALIVVYGAARTGAYLLGLPVPGIIAAGVLAAVSVVVSLASRPLHRSILRHEGRRG